MKRDIFAQLRAVGFDIHMHKDTPRIDEWYVTTPTGQWGPFSDMLQALVEGVRMLIDRTIQQPGDSPALQTNHLMPVHIQDLELVSALHDGAIITRWPSGDHITYKYQGYVATFRRMEAGEAPNFSYAVVVRYDGELWITATYNDFDEWLALSETTLNPDPDLGVFGRFLEDLDRSE